MSARLPVWSIAPIPGLLVPFPMSASVPAVIRRLLFDVLHAPDDTASAQLVYARAVSGGLSALFAGSPRAQEPIGPPDAVPRFVSREAAFPAAVFALEEGPKYGVGSAVAGILSDALQDSLPQRRLEGWCALLCLCALNRTDL